VLSVACRKTDLVISRDKVLIAVPFLISLAEFYSLLL